MVCSPQYGCQTRFPL